MTTTLNVRIDQKVKTQATKALAGMGLDMSSAVKLFLYQVVREQGLPFKPTQNPADIRARWDREAQVAIKSGKKYGSGKKALEDL